MDSSRRIRFDRLFTTTPAFPDDPTAGSSGSGHAGSGYTGSGSSATHPPDHGVVVRVRSQYLARFSNPSAGRFRFAYHIEIENRSAWTVQLLARSWTICHNDGTQEKVQGEGVVGEQPILAPGESFEYSSGCELRTPSGSMEGEYTMLDGRGRVFEAPIRRFELQMPYSQN